jgi:hypothetical protein
MILHLIYLRFLSRASLLVPARSPVRPVRHSGPRRSRERGASTTAASRARAEARPATGTDTPVLVRYESDQLGRQLSRSEPIVCNDSASTSYLLLATSASLAISAERPAISECRCATIAGAGLLSVPARERNQGSGLSGRGHGRPERAAGLAAGDEHVSRGRVAETCVERKPGNSRMCPAVAEKQGLQTDAHDAGRLAARSVAQVARWVIHLSQVAVSGATDGGRRTPGRLDRGWLGTEAGDRSDAG